MLNIYTETDQEEYWLSQIEFADYKTTQSLEEWMYLPNRIAIIEIKEFSETTHQLLSELVGLASHVVIIIHELISDAWIKEFDRSCVTFFIAGKLNYSTRNAKVYFYPYFITSTVAFYRTHPEILKQLDSKPKFKFDVLLGGRKSHRDRIFEQFDPKTNVVRYFPDVAGQDITQYDSDQFEWPELCSNVQEPITFTAQEVRVLGTIVSLSQIIPTNIYNRTCYSMVAETLTDNNYSFFTEKIIKPMLARRLFVVAAGQHYLRNLRSLGFRTFDGIVDETYDTIEQVDKRVDAACHVANSLVTINDQNLLQEIIEHNYQHLMSTDWNKQMIKQLEKVIAGIQ
jgi:hypothetical protein